MLMFPIVHPDIDLGLTRDWFFYCESLKKNTAKEKRCLELFKNVRVLLNKVTSLNVQDLAEQFERLPVTNAVELYAIACMLHDKALDEEHYSEQYAQVCKILSLQFIAKPKSVKYPENISFQELVISCCQNFFEAKPRIQDFGDTVLNMIFYEAMDPELLTTEEELAIQRIRAIGNAKYATFPKLPEVQLDKLLIENVFVGELYNVGLLSRGIIHRCNIYLLYKSDELSMECLCRLIATIGKSLQNECDKLEMNSDYYFLQYFIKMNDTLACTDFSTRVKFMVQDLIELAKNNWVPRRIIDNDDDEDTDEEEDRRRTNAVLLRLHV